VISKNISSLLFCFFLLSCAPQDSEIEIPKTSQVENLIEHSKEFERKVYSYDTPGGKIHVAIGFGIANSIMVEGDLETLLLIHQTVLMRLKRYISFLNKKTPIQLKPLFIPITMEIILLELHIT